MSISNLQNYIYNGVDGYTYVVNPDRLYVSSFSSNEVLEVDASTGQITARIPSNKFPFQSILVNQELLTFTLWESTPPYIVDKDVDPWIFFLTCPPIIDRSIWHQTNTLTIGGLNVITPVSVPNLYSCEIWKNGINVGQSTTAFNGDTLYLRFLTPSTPNTKIELPLFIGERHHFFESTTKSHDLKINKISFNDINSATINTEYTSNEVIISGIDSDEVVNISCVDGIIIKNSIVVGTSTTCVNGDTLQLKSFSSSLYSTSKHILLTVNDFEVSWNIVTEHDINDTQPIPAPLTFIDVIDAELNNIIISDPVIISETATIDIEPLSYNDIIVNSISRGFTYTVSPGDQLQIKTKSSYDYNTSSSVNIYCKGVLSTFTVTTLQDTVIDYIAYHTNHYVPLNGRTVSNQLNVSGLSSGQSVELELVPINIANSYFENLMDVRFLKNGIDTESRFVVVENLDQLSVSALVCGASWNGFVQEFKIYQITRVFDEFNELVEIQRVQEVGFWRYVTAYLEAPFWNKQKESLIFINHNYEKGLVYSGHVDITEIAEKRPAYGIEVSRECQISTANPIQINQEYIRNNNSTQTADVHYVRNIYNTFVESSSIEYVIQKKNSFNVDRSVVLVHKNIHSQDTGFVVSGVTKRTLDTEFVVSGVTKRTLDTEFVVSGVTKRTQDVSYDRIPEPTIRTQDTEFVISGVTKRTQDTDFIVSGVTKRTLDTEFVVSGITKITPETEFVQRTRNIILSDNLNATEPVHVVSSHRKILDGLVPDIVKKSISSVDTSYFINNTNRYVIDSDFLSTRVYKHTVIDSFNFTKFVGANTAQFASTLLISTKAVDRNVENDFIKEKYYHRIDVDSVYSLGGYTKFIEFESPYEFQSRSAKSIGIIPDIEKYGNIGTIETAIDYSKFDKTSIFSPESQYYVTEYSGVKLFESSCSVASRTSNNFEYGVSRQSNQSYTVSNDYTVPGKTIRTFETEVGKTTVSTSSFLSCDYIINNSHSVVSVHVDAVRYTPHIIVVNNAGYITKGTGSTCQVDRTVQVNKSNSKTIDNDGYEIQHSSSVTSQPTTYEISKFGEVKTVSYGSVEVIKNNRINVSRDVEVFTAHSHGEEDFIYEQYREFDSDVEAINYAISLGTIINPKAMRLSSGKWFYYGDANIQNASCKISYNYPKEGYIHGG